MPRNPDFIHFELSDLFSHHTLELTFRLLRNNNPSLALAIKIALDELELAPAEALFAITSEMHLNTDLLKSLSTTTIIKTVAALNEIARSALKKKDLPPQHMRVLRNLIEDWAQLAEWILEHSTSERAAFH